MELNKKTIAVLLLVLVIGFAIGYGIKAYLDRDVVGMNQNRCYYIFKNCMSAGAGDETCVGILRGCEKS